jgi:hypothetical protein
MHPGVQALGRLGIDVALADDATKRCLYVRSRTAEAVVEIQMAKGGIHIIPPQQSNNPASEPNALRVAGWPINQARRLREFIDLALRVLGGVGWLGRRGLVAGLRVAVLGRGGQGSEH